MSEWSAIRDAVQAAVVSTSGLGAGFVRWSYQDVNQEALPFIEISIPTSRRVGQDGTRSSYDSGRPAGQEIKIEVIGLRAVQLQIECYTDETVASTTSVDAEELLEKTRTGFTLPSVMDALAALEVSTFDLDAPLQYLPTLVSEKFRGRAVLEIGMYMPAPAVFEYTTFIEQASGVTTIRGGVGGTHTRSWTVPQ